MVPVSLYDEVTVEAIPEGIVVECDDPGVPTDATNSCHRAASLFREWAGSPAGVRIRLQKGIPSQAGLGGGSSDAAATLKGLCALTGHASAAGGAPRHGRARRGRRPVLHPGLRGAGGRVRRAHHPDSRGRSRSTPSSCCPAFGLSTREGYERLRRGAMEPPPRGRSRRSPTWPPLRPSVRNDFEEAWAPDLPGNRPDQGGAVGRGRAGGGAVRERFRRVRAVRVGGGCAGALGECWRLPPEGGEGDASWRGASRNTGRSRAAAAAALTVRRPADRIPSLSWEVVQWQDSGLWSRI